MNAKNYMITSIDAGKSFDKTEHPFMIQAHSKIEIEGTYLNIMKAMYDKAPASIIFNRQKLQVSL